MPEGDYKRLLRFKGLVFANDDGALLGPVDFALNPGQKVLITSDIFVLPKLISLAIGWSPPFEGEAFYKDSPVFKDGEPNLDPWTLGNEISIVRRDSELLFGRTLYEHILTQYLYNSPAPREELKEKAASYVEKIGLKEKSYKLRSQDLSERERRLGLFAAAIAKEPELFILERPMQFLDKDFLKVWKIITDMTKEKSAVLVLGREKEGYSKDDFDEAIKL